MNLMKCRFGRKVLKVKLTNAFKDRRFREEIITNIILFLVYEFMLYILFFELPLDFLRFKLKSYILGGIVAIIGIVLLALGIGNKNNKMKAYSIEAIVFSVVSFLAYYILTKAPQTLMIKSKTIYLFIPFVMYLVYFVVKSIIIIKNKLKR